MYFGVLGYDITLYVVLSLNFDLYDKKIQFGCCFLFFFFYKQNKKVHVVSIIIQLKVTYCHKIYQSKSSQFRIQAMNVQK